jgi:hypothetical protein
MSEIQEVDLIVRPDGTIRVEVRGVKGPKCLALTEEIEKLLGGRVIERIATDELNQQEQEIVQEEWAPNRSR